ncbi:S53 family serine peptidase [Granulicella tundricola]|nr:S53 family serine peptidase [Granulicella tundricola]
MAASFVLSSPAFAQNAVISQHVPAVVRSGVAPRLQPLTSFTTMELQLTLPIRNEAALDAELADIYNPASPKFHQYLTSAEFDRKYAPTEADYQTLIRWAHNKGFAVTLTTPNRRLISVSATTDVVNRAFNVTETEFRDNVLARTFHAPDREPTTDLPIRLFAISGLDDSIPKHNHLKQGTRAQRSAATHLITGSGPQNTYLPSDMRAAYYGTGPLDGTGQTVAIYSYDGYLTSDLSVFATNTGTPDLTAKVKNVLVGGYAGKCFASSSGTSGTCDDGEQILDIEQVGGMAPGIKQILFYEGTSAVAELNQMATDNLATVITSSWGGGDFGPANDTTFKQMAAQGQTFMNATGDSGALNSSTYSAPSVDPYILEVGGTDLVTSGAGGAWVSEDSWSSSTGGFFSASSPIPSWQQTPGVITTANQGSTTLRNVPDISAEADFDNPTVTNGSFQLGYGGTSFAAPRIAGLIALANQQSAAQGGKPVGFFNPALYALGLGATAAANLHDITNGANPSQVGTAVSFNAVPGYDLVTGWGSPNGATFLNSLVSSLLPDFSMALSANTVTMVRGTTDPANSINLAITSLQGFTSAVNLTVSGLPANVTASFSPATATTSSVLTFTADPTVQSSTSAITVTGTSGALTHSYTLTLNVLKRASGDFTMSLGNTNVALIPGGKSGLNAVTITPGANFVNPLTLSLSALPPSTVGATFTTNPTLASSNLTLAAAAAAPLGTFPMTVSATNGTLLHSVPFNLILTNAQLLGNPGFENGTDTTPWIATGGIECNTACTPQAPNSGSYFLWMDGYGKVHTDYAYQTVTVPSGYSSLVLSFALHINTVETTTTLKNDVFTVQILDPNGVVLATPFTFSNLDAATGYIVHTANLSPYSGQTITLKFMGVENKSLATSFTLDDVSLTVQ